MKFESRCHSKKVNFKDQFLRRAWNDLLHPDTIMVEQEEMTVKPGFHHFNCSLDGNTLTYRAKQKRQELSPICFWGREVAGPV